MFKLRVCGTSDSLYQLYGNRLPEVPDILNLNLRQPISLGCRSECYHGDCVYSVTLYRLESPSHYVLNEKPRWLMDVILLFRGTYCLCPKDKRS
jgi:hypothetical protein